MRTASAASPRPLPGRAVMAAVVAGTIAWIGVIAIGLQLAGRSASSLGFDLELLIEAGRDVAAGRSPYADELVAGGAPMATSLFYSYPPPVAQVFSLLAAVPSRVILVLWSVGAVIGLLVVTELLRRRLAPHRSRGEVLLVVAACAPLTLPFAVGLLFGNLDIWFPFLYGAMLLAAVAPGRATAVGGGVALALAAVKLHPASLGFWFLVRAFRDRRPEGRAAAGRRGGQRGRRRRAHRRRERRHRGARPVARVPGRRSRRRRGHDRRSAECRNRGPGRRRSSVPTTPSRDRCTSSWPLPRSSSRCGPRWRRPDPVESFAWATAASLATLPVTWYHYPSALIPIAVAAMLRAIGAGAASRVDPRGGRRGRRRGRDRLAAAAVGRDRAHRGCGAGVGTGAGAWISAAAPAPATG